MKSNAGPETTPRGASAHGAAARGYAAIVLLLALGLPMAMGAQDSSADDELFGEETVTEAAVSGAEGSAAPAAEFLKYEAVRVGGSISGSLGISATWTDPWAGSLDLLDPDSHSLTPSLSGRIELIAKPSSDFGVNMVVKTGWPFSTSHTVASGATDNTMTGPDESEYSFSVPTLSIWSFYSKFSWKDSLFMSFGKQSLSWGVAKGAFQPADDIFALTNVALDDTGAEREGPVSFKAMLPVPRTMTAFYLLAGVPDVEDLGLEDLRLALKGETSLGNSEIAAAAYYAYDDHPRGLLMATTGTGDFNFYGEAVLKYGSERYFIKKAGLLPYPANLSGSQREADFFLSGAVGGYYYNADWNLTAAAEYFFNGEAQTEVNATEAFTYYLLPGNTDKIDRMRLGAHYAFVSLTKSKLLLDDLSLSLIALGNLSDLSGMVMPSLSWRLFDYASLKLGASFSFGADGDEFTIQSGGKPSASVSATLSIGSGSF